MSHLQRSHQQEEEEEEEEEVVFMLQPANKSD